MRRTNLSAHPTTFAELPPDDWVGKEETAHKGEKEFPRRRHPGYPQDLKISLLKAPGIVSPEYDGLFSPRPQAKALTLRAGGDKSRIKVNQPCQGGVKGHGIPGKGQKPHETGFSVSGAVTLHRYHCVHDEECRTEETVEIHERSGKTVWHQEYESGTPLSAPLERTQAGSSPLL